MLFTLTEKELDERISRNYARLCAPYYQINEVFSPVEYDWPGDKEGRALLAFVCHARMGKEIPCMQQMIKALPARVNAKGYLGTIEEDVIDEQRLSGHSWYLRGLCAYAEAYGTERVMTLISDTVTHLYLPLRNRISTYPLHDRRGKGGVSGNSGDTVAGWRLSSDIGCAFMAIDGLSHAYTLMKTPALAALLREMVEFYDGIDKEALGAQTHCTLTAARGMMRMYEETKDSFYLDCAKRIADLYLKSGMTLTFQNMNWWGRPDSWTEPCAIVDSLILFRQLIPYGYDPSLCRRVYHNAFRTLQRDNGGAGCETVTLPGQSKLSVFMDEAPFCCSMRLAEGLLTLFVHRDDFSFVLPDPLSLDEMGRRMRGDLIYVKVTPDLQAYIDPTLLLSVEGTPYAPLPLFYRIPLENVKSLCIDILA